MKVWFTLLLISYSSFGYTASFPVPIHAESAILINGKTGRVIYEKDANRQHYPASITKIATAVLAIEKRPDGLQDQITASQDALGWVSEQEKSRDNYNRYPNYWLETGASHIGIKRGEVLTMQDLLYGLMLASADDAANVLAEHVSGGSIPRFITEMNTLMARLGCTRTNFCNPHGLFHPNHVTTCADIATLCRYAMQNDLFRKIVKTTRYERPTTNKQKASMLLQTNKLLLQGNSLYCKEAVGIKTGYIAKARHTFACAAEKDGRLLIAVYMKCPDRKDLFRDAKAVFDAAFSQKTCDRVVVASGDQPFTRKVEGAFHSLKTCTLRPLVARYIPQEEPVIRCQLTWDDVSLPIKAGSKVGSLVIFADDVAVDTTPLYARYEVNESFLSEVWRFLTSRTAVMVMLLGVASTLFLIGRRMRS